MAFRTIDDKLKTKAVFALECGASIRTLARELGVHHQTVRRWSKEIGKEPKPVKYGAFDREGFRKDLMDLIDEEGIWAFSLHDDDLADMITDLAAASLRRKSR